MTTVQSSVSAASAAIVIVTMTTMVEREKEEDKKGKMKKFHFSKQVGFVLERENKFFLGRKERNPKLFGGEVGWFFFRRTKSFSVERTKVGGLNLMMVGTFSRGINNCSIRLDSFLPLELHIMG